MRNAGEITEGPGAFWTTVTDTLTVSPCSTAAQARRVSAASGTSWRQYKPQPNPLQLAERVVPKTLNPTESPQLLELWCKNTKRSTTRVQQH